MNNDLVYDLWRRLTRAKRTGASKSSVLGRGVALKVGNRIHLTVWRSHELYTQLCVGFLILIIPMDCMSQNSIRTLLDLDNCIHDHHSPHLLDLLLFLLPLQLPYYSDHQFL